MNKSLINQQISGSKFDTHTFLHYLPNSKLLKLLVLSYNKKVVKRGCQERNYEQLEEKRSREREQNTEQVNHIEKNKIFTVFFATLLSHYELYWSQKPTACNNSTNAHLCVIY